MTDKQIDQFVNDDEDDGGRNFVSDEERESAARDAAGLPDAASIDAEAVLGAIGDVQDSLDLDDLAPLDATPAVIAAGTLMVTNDQGVLVPATPAQAAALAKPVVPPAAESGVAPAGSTAAPSEPQVTLGDVAAASAQIEAEKKAPRVRKVTIAGVVRELRPGEQKVTRSIDIPLSSESYRRKNEEKLAAERRAEQKLAELKAHAADVRVEVKADLLLAKKLHRELEADVEPVEIACVELYEDRRQDVVTVRLDTGEEISSRPMTGPERQVGMPGIADAPAPTKAVEAPAPVDPTTVTAEGVGVVETPAKAPAKRTRRTKAEMEAARAQERQAAQ